MKSFLLTIWRIIFVIIAACIGLALMGLGLLCITPFIELVLVVVIGIFTLVAGLVIGCLALIAGICLFVVPVIIAIVYGGFIVDACQNKRAACEQDSWRAEWKKETDERTAKVVQECAPDKIEPKSKVEPPQKKEEKGSPKEEPPTDNSPSNN